MGNFKDEFKKRPTQPNEAEVYEYYVATVSSGTPRQIYADYEYLNSWVGGDRDTTVVMLMRRKVRKQKSEVENG